MRGRSALRSPVYDMYSFNTAPHEHAPIIGLSGWATSGKDSVGEVLTRLYGYQRVSFADNLKAFVRDVNPIVDVQHEPGSSWGPHVRRAEALVQAVGDREAKQVAEYRRLLQDVGNKAREHFGENVWVNAAFRTLDPDKHYVITDCRYKNEAQAIKDRGGIVLRVMRPGVEPLNDHVSEIDLDDWPFDGFVMNDGTLLDLEGEVQRVLGDLG